MRRGACAGRGPGGGEITSGAGRCASVRPRSIRHTSATEPAPSATRSAAGSKSRSACSAGADAEHGVSESAAPRESPRLCRLARPAIFAATHSVS